MTIPTGEYSPAFALAWTPQISAAYNVCKSWGSIGIGILSGSNIQPTNETAAYQSVLLSIPAAALVRYTTNFDSPLSLFIEAAGGVAINILHYTETYTGRTDYSSVKPFLYPAAGIGFSIGGVLNLSGCCGFMMIFYDDAVYMGISPGIRFGIDL